MLILAKATTGTATGAEDIRIERIDEEPSIGGATPAPIDVEEVLVGVSIEDEGVTATISLDRKSVV